MKDEARRAKVLIIDDRREILDILMSALGDQYAVIAARSGKKGLALARREPLPDLILLDIIMSDLDGYEVCRRLKANEQTQDIPIIFLTALADEKSELKGLRLGAVDYVYKPISIPLVQTRVSTHVALTQARRQLAKQVAVLSEVAQLRDDVDRIMRHDLKSPLNAILGFSTLLRQKEGVEPNEEQWVQSIYESGVKILYMVNHSLDLYKMEQGSYQYHPQKVELVQVVHRVVADLRSLAEQYGVTVVVKGEVCDACAEEILCYSMVCNLVKNGIEATPNGSEMSVTLSQNQQTVRLAFENPGAVPAPLHETFFDRYTTAGKKGGTGLGTYSARLMAETMLGRIEMKSSEESGTCVQVWLPSELAAQEVISQLASRDFYNKPG